MEDLQVPEVQQEEHLKLNQHTGVPLLEALGDLVQGVQEENL
jgi:hypothetical protein